jgi:hypothetical protein
MFGIISKPNRVGLFKVNELPLYCNLIKFDPAFSYEQAVSAIKAILGMKISDEDVTFLLR